MITTLVGESARTPALPSPRYPVTDERLPIGDTWNNAVLKSRRLPDRKSEEAISGAAAAGPPDGTPAHAIGIQEMEYRGQVRGIPAPMSVG
ncbi:hypothetical protein ACIP98_35130 [Streptomyces sp. NPDC088354]|uniref:hypothetical protein n=1 Tax=Streptomyces sp. NPDC088354 TaxID=3365856 RepID=UPI00381D51E8